MKRFMKTAALVAALAMMIGCSSNTTTDNTDAQAAPKNNPHGEKVLNTVSMGSLMVDLPGDGEVQTQELPAPENAEYAIESATMYFYVIPKFRVRATRVIYADPANPDMDTLSTSIHERIDADPNVDYASPPETLNVSGKAAKTFTIGYDEDADPVQYGRAVVIEEQPGIFWLVDFQTIFDENMAVSTMELAVKSLAMNESGENK